MLADKTYTLGVWRWQGQGLVFPSPHQQVPERFTLIRAGKLLIWGQRPSRFTAVCLASACALQKLFLEANLEAWQWQEE